MKSYLRYFGPGQCNGDFCSRYWVYWRLDHNVNVGSPNQFFRCDSGVWAQKYIEGYFTSDGSYCSGREWRLKHTNGAETINFVPVARVEQATPNCPRMHDLLWHDLEWDGGNGNNSFYPTVYDNDENINNKNIVLWYESRAPWKEACERGGTENCTTGFDAFAVGY